jgi:hypothetical protein
VVGKGNEWWGGEVEAEVGGHGGGAAVVAEKRKWGGEASVEVGAASLGMGERRMRWARDLEGALWNRDFDSYLLNFLPNKVRYTYIPAKYISNLFKSSCLTRTKITEF